MKQEYSSSTEFKSKTFSPTKFALFYYNDYAVKHVYTERNALFQTDNPYVVKIFYSFQSKVSTLIN